MHQSAIGNKAFYSAVRTVPCTSSHVSLAACSPIAGPRHNWELDLQRGDLLIARMGRYDSSRGPPQRQKFSNSSYGDGQQQEPNKRSSRRPRDAGGESDDEEEAPGWWEVPRDERQENQVTSLDQLEDWQVAKLETAYAMGRRKTAVQELARELGVDRSFVTAWFKEFKNRPKEDVDAIMASRKAELAAETEIQRRKEAQQAAVEAAVGPSPASQLRPPGVPEEGFIPFYLRKQLGMDKSKRINGEALRTLEALYDRTPFPSSDMVKGLYDLHRLQRDVVVAWFSARREADGIESSTQKRTSRPSDRERDKNALVDAFNSELQGGDDAGGDSRVENLLEGFALSKGGGLPPKSQEAKPTTVVSMSKRELAQLRSSLPSPRKMTGQKLAQDLGIKTGTGNTTTQIGDLAFVEDEVTAAERMRGAWRYRDTAAPTKLRLPRGNASASSSSGAGPASSVVSGSARSSSSSSARRSKGPSVDDGLEQDYAELDATEELGFPAAAEEDDEWSRAGRAPGNTGGGGGGGGGGRRGGGRGGGRGAAGGRGQRARGSRDR